MQNNILNQLSECLRRCRRVATKATCTAAVAISLAAVPTITMAETVSLPMETVNFGQFKAGLEDHLSVQQAQYDQATNKVNEKKSAKRKLEQAMLAVKKDPNSLTWLVPAISFTNSTAEYVKSRILQKKHQRSLKNERGKSLLAYRQKHVRKVADYMNTAANGSTRQSDYDAAIKELGQDMVDNDTASDENQTLDQELQVWSNIPGLKHIIQGQKHTLNGVPAPVRVRISLIQLVDKEYRQTLADIAVIDRQLEGLDRSLIRTVEATSYLQSRLNIVAQKSGKTNSVRENNPHR
ncbi:MAG: hypothetical protein HQL69_12265 [Magnetococcales bacterium]|nr:hypothetical protein [Magnetococcales bacterium]